MDFNARRQDLISDKLGRYDRNRNPLINRLDDKESRLTIRAFLRE
jgi:hypothetical protein